MEKAAMLAAHSPFLIRLAASFEREMSFHLLQEAALGGDLHTVYQRKNLYGSENHSRYYIASVVCALEHLHSLSIIFRDVKMENLVLDAIGICKLCDFGAAAFKPNKQISDDDDTIMKTYTLTGTPEYMAPEVVSGRGYHCAADWWSVGILLYELQMAETPFEAEEIESVYSQILVGFPAALLPVGESSWGDLVRGFCQEDSSQRLPMLGGARKVKAHQWFAKVDFDWDAFEQCAMPAPYVPMRCWAEDLPYAAALIVPKALPEAAFPGGFEETLGPAHLNVYW
jgi:serine/threonine protein kinase